MKLRNLLSSQPPQSVFVWPIVMLLFLLTGAVEPAWAQSATPAKADQAVQKDPGLNALKDDRYRIGPGDLLDIRVFNRPQLSRDGVRVGGRGTIVMPLITDEIMAACRTEAELAQEITRRYIKYQRNPQVDVFVKEYNSRPVAIMGAVNSPGRFQLQRRIRLLELLSFAGGPTAKAGRVVQITSSPKFIDCEVVTSEDPIPSTSEAQEATTAVYNLRDALQGKEGANPYLRAGDIVKVPDAELVFVVGNVTTPSAIALNERITVTRAIAVAGGVLPNTKKSQVRILRDDPATRTKSEILVDLKAISKHQVPDPVLEAGDILEVPTVTGFQRALAGMLNGLMGLPITAIR